MSPGDRVSGYVGFAVPTDAQLAGHPVLPRVVEDLDIGDLVGGGGATPTEPHPARPLRQLRRRASRERGTGARRDA